MAQSQSVKYIIPKTAEKPMIDSCSFYQDLCTGNVSREFEQFQANYLDFNSYTFFYDFAPLKARGATTRRGATRRKEEIK